MDSSQHDLVSSSSLEEENMAILQNLPIPPALDLSLLSKKSRRCIERLMAHKAESVDLTRIHHKKQAAVLVLLYEKEGNLRVLLTTRSKTLRAHPGQTALPGGKVDDTDKDVVHTAYREALEEVGLPIGSPHIHTLCLLRQFVSAWKLVVTPVVALLTDLSILDKLTPSEGEVDVIFDHPLEAILDPALSASENLVPIGSEHWPSDAEFHNFTDNVVPWLRNSGYRMHRFRSTASPVKGLTAEILIEAAVIAYDRPPSFVRFAPGQLTSIHEIIRAAEASSVVDVPKAESALGQPAQEAIVGRHYV